MNVPGFTAESSIYKTTNKYRLSAGGAESTSGVQPAFIPHGRCWQACCWYDPATGAFECDDGCMICCRNPSPRNCQ
jgi:hypothetical protein